MKYKAVYDVLNERRQTTPGFCYDDRSGWRASPQTYMTIQRPLWIIAEDPDTGCVADDDLRGTVFLSPAPGFLVRNTH